MKLKVQILLIFILTSIAIVAVTGYLYYVHIQKILVDQHMNGLKAVSKDKSARVNMIVQNKIVELEILKRSPVIKTELYRYQSDFSDGAAKISLYNSLIRSKEAIVGINRMVILDRSGNVVISSNPSNTSREGFKDYRYFKNNGNEKGIQIEYRYNEHEELVLCLASKIDSSFVMLIENDVNSIISVTEDYTGLGATGESAIFTLDDDGDVKYLTPLRFYSKAFLKDTIKENVGEFVRAINKGNLVFPSVFDYRGHNVIASVSKISKTDWLLITKMDVEETLFYMKQIRKTAFVYSLLIIFVVSLIIYLAAYFFLRPINELAHTAEVISQGDFTKRVEVKYNNEVGQLATSFNKMTGSLVAVQKDLQNKLTELNRSNSALDKFAHVVSHDIKTPLNSIEGLANLLKLELAGKISPYEMEVVSKINEQTKKTKGMIKGILEYAELKAKKGDTEQVDINELIENVRSTIDIPAHIKVLVVDRLPIIQIEKVLIYQIFQNLISNAVKYMDKGEGLIKIGCAKKAEGYLFYVSDNGIGIAEEDQSKIFDIFNTAGAEKGYDNTGIGLSIVKSVISDKGGSVWVESKQGEGSTFYFVLPENQV